MWRKIWCSLEAQFELIMNANRQALLVKYSLRLQGLVGNILSFYRRNVFEDFFIEIHRTRGHRKAFSVNSDGTMFVLPEIILKLWKLHNQFFAAKCV